MKKRYAAAALQSSAVAIGLSLALSGCGGSSDTGPSTPSSFAKISEFNVPGQVAEIITASPDGQTLVYTDSETREIGFLNVDNPAALTVLGRLDVTGSPTSVTITKDGRFVLAVVDGAPDELLVVNLQARTILRRIPLGGQPDCIALSPDGRYAAIAIENQRADEDATLPQAPGGFMTIVDLVGEPAAWTTRNVELANLTGMRFPTDPEPEFIDINSQNRAAVTLQENNAIAIVNLATGTVERSFSAGTVTHAADTIDNGAISFTSQIVNARREPDGIAWTPSGNLITANEGDYDLDLTAGQFTGGRGFTVFSPTGQVLFDVADNLEREAATAGVYPDGRSDNKGTEPEAVEVAQFGGRTFAFIGMERADSVAVYRLDSDSTPQFVQILKTGDAPEGALAIPSRNLFVTANEDDGTISVFRP
jgi:DNA-binding beta-propeller fold protein YncE